MERCTLCGGKLAKGICTECGFNNEKNDRKYHLNIHNEKSVMFQHETCEENLNQPKRTRVAGKKGTAEHKTHTAAKRASGKKAMPEPKKKPALAGVIFGIGVFAIAVQFLGMFAEDSLPAFETVFEHGTDDDLWEADDFWNEEEVREKPELIQWEKTGEHYFELVLVPGFYNIGYDIPAGKYQLYCGAGSAWVSWRNAGDAYSSGVSLQSVERQAEMEEYGLSRQFENSEALELQDGGMICLEDCDGLVVIRGERSGEVREYEPQELSEEIVLQGGMEPGKDFPAGVYDLVLQNYEPEDTYPALYVTVENREEGTYDMITLDSDHEKFRRFPFYEGAVVTDVEKYAEDADVKLVPSY